MGFLDIFKRQKPKQPELSQTQLSFIENRNPLKRGSAELAYAYRTTPWLRMCAGRIASLVSSVPWEIYTATNKTNGKTIKNNKMLRLQGSVKQKHIRRAIELGDMVEHEDHPLLDLLARGCRDISGHDVIRLTQIYLDIQGEAYWSILRDPQGKPYEIWPTPPHWVRETPSASQPFYQVSRGGLQFNIPAADMVAFVEHDPVNPYGRGAGIGEALSDELDTDEYAAKYIKTFFYNSAIPDALVGFEGAGSEEVKAAEKRWMDKFRGPLKSHRVSFHNGKVDVKLLNHSFKDQDVVSLRKSERDIVLQVFGIPPEAVGIIENSNRATIDGATYVLAKWVTVPRLDKICSVIQNKLMPEWDDRGIVCYENPVPEDNELQFKYAQSMPWAITRGEARERMGFDRLEGDDVYVMSAGQLERPADGSGFSFETIDPSAEKSQLKKKGLIHKIDDDDRNRVLSSVSDADIADEIMDLFRDRLEEWGDRSLTELGLSGNFNMVNPAVVDHLSDFSGTRIVGINNTTRSKIREALAAGVESSEGVDQIADRIRDVFALASSYRAEMIARTEVLRSSNFSKGEAYEQSGVVVSKQWIATPDDRARDSHPALGGQIVGLSESFSISGASAKQPGDFGVPELDINCRCTVAPITRKENAAGPWLTVWKQFDRALIPWEREAERAMKRAFAKQQEKALAALRK